MSNVCSDVHILEKAMAKESKNEIVYKRLVGETGPTFLTRMKAEGAAVVRVFMEKCYFDAGTSIS